MLDLKKELSIFLVFLQKQRTYFKNVKRKVSLLGTELVIFHDAIIGILGHSMTHNIDWNILHTSCCGTCCIMSDIIDIESYIFLTAMFFNIV
jgi:hypothetical protein